MKAKIAIAIFLVFLVLAQIIFGGKKPQPESSGPASPAAPAELLENPGAETTLLDAHSPDTHPFLPRPSAEDVTGIAVGSGDGALRLERGAGRWNVVGAASAPADSDKVETLLSDLLTAQLHPLLESEKADTGLDEDGGLPVKLAVAGGGDYEMRIGVRPEGRYDSVYVKLPGGGVNILAADVRGELGLWKNTPDAVPDPSAWVEKDVLSFIPDEAVRIEAVYPDHRIIFERQPGADWEQRGLVPGGEWDARALDSWLKDLSLLRVSGVFGAGGLGKDAQTHPQTRHEIKVSLADGTEKAIWVEANHAGEGMLAETSDYPGHLFTLPEWRFRKYFRRLSSLFPKAVPEFEIEDIQFIDIRQGGETVKAAHREGGWEAPAWNYPLRTETVERLATMLSTWRPEDYANPDFKSIRPMFAGPMVEVILSNGRIHQYRLAGRHPLFPWRYVIVDNSSILSVTDADAALMFPELATVLDLGKTLSTRSPEDIREIRLEDGQEQLLVAIRHRQPEVSDDISEPVDSDNSTESQPSHSLWEAKTREDWHAVDDDEMAVILKKMLDWSAAGLYGFNSRIAKPTPMYHLHVVSGGGKEQSIHFLEPDERDIPYIVNERRAYLLERKEFFNWLGAIRGVSDRINAEAEEGKGGEEDQAMETVTVEDESPDGQEDEGETAEVQNTDEVDNVPEAESAQTEPAAVEEHEDTRAEIRDEVETGAGIGDGLPLNEPDDPVDTVAQSQSGHIEPPVSDEGIGLPEEEAGYKIEEYIDSPVHELQGLPEPSEADSHDSEPELIIPSVENMEIYEREPPLDVPLTEPALAPDSDLVQPESSEHVMPDIGSPSTDIQVEQFVTRYIGDV